jgi:hypothetical protein
MTRGVWMIVTIGIFTAGVWVGHVTHSANDPWRVVTSLFSHLSRSPVEWGIFIFLCTAAIIVLAIGVLWLVAGYRLVKSANSYKERLQVFNRISDVLLGALRVSGKNAAFTQEPDNPIH